MQGSGELFRQEVEHVRKLRNRIGLGFQEKEKMAGEAQRCQWVRLCWPCGCVGEAGLHPEGSGNSVEDSELGVMRLERGTGVETQTLGVW